MAQYYYTIAALPYLSLESPPPLSLEEFRSLCRDTLTETDWEILQQSSLFGEEQCENELLSQWHRWEQSFRSELARLRAAKLGIDSDSIPRIVPESGRVLELARAALMESSPAEAELLILKGFWEVLEELEVNHFFDLEKLLVYYLKLQILHLRAQRNREEGAKNFTSMYHRIREQRENPILERWSTQ
ncbi:MAG: DUF2764 domain-containing protein [Spirochaetes bacterium]|nr:DUF2764 domain-containing protein [Spirochaetota bacterium]